MQCSRCSQIVKPVVVLDIDGTLGDYHRHLMQFADAYFDKQRSAHQYYDNSEPYAEWFARTYNVTYEQFRECKLAYRQGGMKRTMPMIDGADLLTGGLHRAEVEIWIATTRPFFRLDNVDKDTLYWLDKHHLNYDYIVSGDDKVEQVAYQVDEDRVIGYLDDLALHCREASLAWPEALVLQPLTPYNGGDRASTQLVFDLFTARDEFVSRAKEWYAAR